MVPYSQADCPYPLKFNPEGTIADPTQSLSSPDQVCVYPCPDPMFTTTEMDAAIGVLTGLGSTLSLPPPAPPVTAATNVFVCRVSCVVCRVSCVVCRVSCVVFVFGVRCSVFGVRVRVRVSCRVVS
jgi:hypothetical protein